MLHCHYRPLFRRCLWKCWFGSASGGLGAVGCGLDITEAHRWNAPATSINPWSWACTAPAACSLGGVKSGSEECSAVHVCSSDRECSEAVRGWGCCMGCGRLKASASDTGLDGEGPVQPKLTGEWGASCTGERGACRSGDGGPSCSKVLTERLEPESPGAA